ncbi:YjfB family protein [Nitrosomonas ureae]|uniref:Putative motility protein n=1 Tax=Nitrosomonas ureae TaxID=44577 RepID=A0A1H5V644_9PROT|nr:YjfB family protein [Nitrosomonas ureae]SEF82656.1 Putative motility protein [Nitrosomonas ureae]
MDVTGIARIATEMANFNTKEAVGIAVLKKAMDINAASALALIEAIPDNSQSAPNLPLNLGRNINTTA